MSTSDQQATPSEQIPVMQEQDIVPAPHHASWAADGVEVILNGGGGGGGDEPPRSDSSQGSDEGGSDPDDETMLRPRGHLLSLFGEAAPLGPNTVRLIITCGTVQWMNLLRGDSLVDINLLIQGRIGDGAVREIEIATPTTIRQARRFTIQDWAALITAVVNDFGAVMNTEQLEAVETLAHVYAWFTGMTMNQEVYEVWSELRDLMRTATVASRRVQAPAEDLIMNIRMWTRQRLPGLLPFDDLDDLDDESSEDDPDMPSLLAPATNTTDVAANAANDTTSTSGAESNTANDTTNTAASTAANDTASTVGAAAANDTASAVTAASDIAVVEDGGAAYYDTPTGADDSDSDVGVDSDSDAGVGDDSSTTGVVNDTHDNAATM